MAITKAHRQQQIIVPFQFWGSAGNRDVVTPLGWDLVTLIWYVEDADGSGEMEMFVQTTYDGTNWFDVGAFHPYDVAAGGAARFLMRLVRGGRAAEEAGLVLAAPFLGFPILGGDLAAGETRQIFFGQQLRCAWQATGVLNSIDMSVTAWWEAPD